MRLLFVPTKSRLDLEKEKCGGLFEALREFRVPETRRNILQSHHTQKRNLGRLLRKVHEEVIDRSTLTPDKIKQHDVFVFLGGDNHFTYGAQTILQYLHQHPQEEKYVLGAVLDPRKSLGKLLYYNVDTLTDNLGNLRKGEIRNIEQWTTLEARVENGDHADVPYPVVSEYFIGERSRLQMSRNIAYLGKKKVLQEKSSGLLVVTGAGSGKGSWYFNVNGKGKENVFEKTDPSAHLFATEQREGRHVYIKKGQTLVINSNNDSQGIIVPDSHEEHSVPFHFGARAYIRISDITLPVIAR